MTRANFIFTTAAGKFKMQSNSSAYPNNVMGDILKFITACASKNAVFGGEIGFYSPDSSDISELVEGVGLTFGHVGNFSYHYEIDFIARKLGVWDSRMTWVNAPEDWKARGWNCWEGRNGKFGYSNWAKGKKLYGIDFINLVEEIDNVFVTKTSELVKALGVDE